MLPFLKRNQDAAASAPIEKIERKSDHEYDELDAVAEDLLNALISKDKSMIKAALQSLMDIIQMADIKQDKEMIK